jgi:hypothetical protein
VALTVPAVTPVGVDGGATSVVALDVADGDDSPPAFVATTRYVYVVAAVSPVSSNVVAPVVPAVAQLAPPLTDRSIR